MTTTVRTRLKIASWNEKATDEYDDGSRTTRATVTLAEGQDGLTRGTFESVMYYRPDGTSAYVSILRLAATLDGRSGTFTVASDGGYDGTTASSSGQVVADSGTDDLAGIAGSLSSASTHDDYPYMPMTLTYMLP